MIVDPSTKRTWQVKEHFILWLSEIGGEVCDEWNGGEPAVRNKT